MEEFENASEMTPKFGYIKPLNVADLPHDLQEQAEGLEHVYALHAEDGERLAIVASHELAKIVAENNHMDAVSLH